jgi:hypothetical protein
MMTTFPRELIEQIIFELVSWHDSLLTGFLASPLEERAREVASLLVQIQHYMSSDA